MGRFLSTAPPNALGDIAISIDPQEAAGREDFHPLSDLTPSRRVSCRQVADQGVVGEGWPSTLQERPDLGCERKGVGSLFAKVKWLDSQPVPHKVEGSAVTVENGECKHPTHVRQAGFSEFLPGFEQCLRIRVPAPRQEREPLANFKMVVNFTIKNDRESPAGADHRLCPCVGEFQDREPPVAQPTETIRRGPLPRGIGPTVPQKAERVLGCVIYFTEITDNSTHR